MSDGLAAEAWLAAEASLRAATHLASQRSLKFFLRPAILSASSPSSVNFFAPCSNTQATAARDQAEGGQARDRGRSDAWRPLTFLCGLMGIMEIT